VCARHLSGEWLRKTKNGGELTKCVPERDSGRSVKSLPGAEI